MTGEISIRGFVKPVGGVAAKVEAAKLAGIKKVFIPKDNWQDLFLDTGIEVIPVNHINELFDKVFAGARESKGSSIMSNKAVNVISASGIDSKNIS